MPPKKKATVKKTKKTADDDALPTTAEENQLLKAQVQSLKHQLIMRENQVTSHEISVRELRQRLLRLHDEYEKEKKRTYDLAADMTRQYKQMKDSMALQIKTKQQTIEELQAKLEAAKHAEAEMKRKNALEISAKDSEIEQAKHKMDGMAESFSAMLKSTLDQMSAKIVMTNDWDTEAQKGPTVRSYEDLNIGLSKSN